MNKKPSVISTSVKKALAGQSQKRHSAFQLNISSQRSVYSLIWKFLFPSLLIVVTVLLAFLNHVPGTWLTGWDTLHPEFNFGLNFSRLLNGVFRQDQGLGTVAVHAHMVELPRIMLLWLASFVLPLQILRYTYIAACLVLGPLGIYIFVNHLLRKTEFSIETSRVAAFCAALWYLFNLGTVQHFIVPFEMFPTNYAANGFLFYSAVRFLESRKKRDLLILMLINFWGSNMAFSFISWYVYFGGLVLFLGSLWLINIFKAKINLIKPILIIFGTILAVNAYWLLPNFYFVIQHAWHIPLSKNNQLISDEIFYHNKQYGTVADTITMQNHLFSWRIREGGEFKLIFEHFNAYLNGWRIGIPYLLFILILVGVVVGGYQFLAKKKTTNSYYFLAFIPVLLASFIVFLTLNPPLETLIAPLRDNVSIFKEGMRNPFIKFNLLLMCAYAVFFGLGIAQVISFIEKKTKSSIVAHALPLLFTVMLTTVLCFPFFTGHLIDKRVQLKIPTEYFEMFSWFNTQSPNKRILVLPAPHFWAWDYHSWAYQGSGFMWFGLPQAFLSRDSDRWNPYNEEVYREISYALSSRDDVLFKQLLVKYHIGWVVFDKTVATNGESEVILDSSYLSAALSNVESFSPKTFSPNLTVYTVNQLAQSNASLLTLASAPAVSPSYLWQYKDEGITRLGYYWTPEKLSGAFFPSRSLLTPTDRVDRTQISWSENTLTQKVSQPGEYRYSLDDVSQLAAKVNYQENDKVLTFSPVLPQGNETREQAGTRISVPTALTTPFSFILNDQAQTVASSTAELPNQVVFSKKQNTLKIYPGAEATSGATPVLSTSFIIRAPEDAEQKIQARDVITYPVLGKTIVIKPAETQNTLDKCGSENKAKLSRDKKEENKTTYIRYSSQYGQTCDRFLLEELSHDTGYIVTVTSRNVQGLPIRFCVRNLTTQKCDVYVPLGSHKSIQSEPFLLPPRYDEGEGYSIHTTNFSAGKFETINDLVEITFTPIPFELMNSVHTNIGDTASNTATLLTNHQSYESGWVAFLTSGSYQVVGRLEHVLLNNWANGWKLSDEQSKNIQSGEYKVRVFFLPQLLEVIGLQAGAAVIVGVIILIVIQRKKVK